MCQVLLVLILFFNILQCADLCPRSMNLDGLGVLLSEYHGLGEIVKSNHLRRYPHDADHFKRYDDELSGSSRNVVDNVMLFGYGKGRMFGCIKEGREDFFKQFCFRFPRLTYSLKRLCRDGEFKEYLYRYSYVASILGNKRSKQGVPMF